MGYGCWSMFTHGQVDRMLGFISAFDTLQALISQENLLATGCEIATSGATHRDGIANFDPLFLPNPSNGSFSIHLKSQTIQKVTAFFKSVAKPSNFVVDKTVGAKNAQ